MKEKDEQNEKKQKRGDEKKGNIYVYICTYIRSNRERNESRKEK